MKFDTKRFKGIIFDLDGTLVDSPHVWQHIDAVFLGKRGLAVPENYFAEVCAMNFSQAADYTIARFGLDDKPEDVVREWFDLAIDEYRHNIPLKPHAAEFLRALNAAGIKIALATAAAPALFEAVLKNHGVYDLFDAFASTGEVARGKGFPDVYILAAERIGLAPADCAVFEDIREGIQGAKDGGFVSVAVLDASARACWDALKTEADYWISSYAELIEQEV
ncbi:MAG: HAD family phosphatase [Oscillospiraceae bacterium]